MNASGITVKPDDPEITADAVEYPGLIAPIQGYLASPRGGDSHPGVLVLHNVDGLTEHARDLARRLAKAGYVALVPDALSRAGGTAKLGDTTKVAQAMSSIAIPQFLQDMNTSVRYLEARPLAAKTRIGMLSFGLGGVFSWYLLTQNPDIKAGVIYYGGIPHDSLLPRVTAAVLAIFGEMDGRSEADLKDLDAAMKKNGAPWSFKVEPKAGRGFFDDTRNPYVPDAAKDAWKLTLDWYAKHLGTG